MMSDIAKQIQDLGRGYDVALREEVELFASLGLSDIRDRLERDWEQACEEDKEEGCLEFQASRDMRGGEIFFVPDIRRYKRVFDLIPPGCAILDVGAGDLRFSIALAARAHHVYAIEINPTILGRALSVIGYDLPSNVTAICGDAFALPVPADVDTVVCIMIRRCHDFPAAWSTRRIVHAEHDGVHVMEPQP